MLKNSFFSNLVNLQTVDRHLSQDFFPLVIQIGSQLLQTKGSPAPRTIEGDPFSSFLKKQTGPASRTRDLAHIIMVDFNPSPCQ
jgi:hypothetical protein